MFFIYISECFIKQTAAESHTVHFSLVIPVFCFFLSQACTGIDNIAEAITLLELNNWDLVVSSLSAGFVLCSLTDRLSPSRVQVQEGS